MWPWCRYPRSTNSLTVSWSPPANNPQFIESRISSRKSPLERRIDEMLGTLQPGDRLLVSELSRLGRSLSQVIQIVETLVRRKIRFIAIKEAIEWTASRTCGPR